MTDKLRFDLYDLVALTELELMSDLMIAANATDHHLTQVAIDTALGLIPLHGSPTCEVNVGDERDLKGVHDGSGSANMV